MDFGFCPGERAGCLVVGFDEAVDVVSQVLEAVERCTFERLTRQDGEPDFHLVEPGGACRGEVEVDIWMAFEPAVAFRLVGAEVVEDDMDLTVLIGFDDAVHEVEEFDASAAFVLAAGDLAGGDIEGGEPGCRGVPPVVMRLASERPPVR